MSFGLHCMQSWLAIGLWLTSLAQAQSPFAPPGEPLDYSTLSHKLSLELLRAGTHDASGSNDYYFVVTMYGLLNTPEERNLEFAKRQKLTVELGSFGDTKLDALSIWRPDEKTKEVKELAVEGDQIRELTARVMRELKVPEPEVVVMIVINLFEREKKFRFFGDDRQLAKTEFYPLPPTLFDHPIRTNKTLQMQDDKGLEVKIAVRYDRPAERGKNSSSANAAKSTATATATKTSN